MSNAIGFDKIFSCFCIFVTPINNSLKTLKLYYFPINKIVTANSGDFFVSDKILIEGREALSWSSEHLIELKTPPM